ncbi:chloramphenicol acetyltransferase [Maribellus comscasis]|uniref:Chloramphenicol acetyltransferase n=1 Tax=Maribellus comscasis TaxID=2681766 RepID=A0A6I6JS50_9BACT|nr:chloramphenicol acetyltransferase [Maribellus comscasis]QGY42982.1 chloramphenicol acetyltransferase [Maribellus comscasis]
MKTIDIENWDRKEHFLFFSRMDYPQYNICMDIDVTNFLAFIKARKLSFYYSMIYVASTALNRIKNFRYRIRDGKVVLHDQIHPSFTDMDEDKNAGLFKFVTLDLRGDIETFEKKAKEANKNQTEYFEFEKLAGRDDLIFITCIPWISFTHISHTISLNKNDSVPRISWGKYFKRDEKVCLPFSVQVNHALVDGLHIGKYIDELQQYIDNLK